MKLLKINKMKVETYTKKTYGHCKCSPLDVIVRFENSNISSFVWGHRYTFLNDTEKRTNIFRCANCKKIIHDNFVAEKQKENYFAEFSKWIVEKQSKCF
jgi:hypothetical protein